jgi:hypothetical protein
MRYLFIAFTLFITTASFGQGQANTDSATVQAHKEADKWQKTLKLDEEQKQKIFVICLTSIVNNAELIKNGGHPPEMSPERNGQFHEVLTEEQYSTYMKIAQANLRQHPPRKKQSDAAKK